jgi:hypothetical protein
MTPPPSTVLTWVRLVVCYPIAGGRHGTCTRGRMAQQDDGVNPRGMRGMGCVLPCTRWPLPRIHKMNDGSQKKCMNGKPDQTAAGAAMLRYSVRAPPTPTPSLEVSPPTEMSTGGLNSEQAANACNSIALLFATWRVLALRNGEKEGKY